MADVTGNAVGPLVGPLVGQLVKNNWWRLPVVFCSEQTFLVCLIFGFRTGPMLQSSPDLVAILLLFYFDCVVTHNTGNYCQLCASKWNIFCIFLFFALFFKWKKNVLNFICTFQTQYCIEKVLMCHYVCVDRSTPPSRRMSVHQSGKLSRGPRYSVGLFHWK